MKISGFLRQSLIGLVVVLMVPLGAFSQERATSGKAFSQAELDQMLAPIALYPDALIAQILVAATFPDQVAEADRWLEANPNPKGDAFNDALDKMNWDLSVKALAPFPEVLAMMVKHTAWTQKLGEAFVTQEPDVIASVQRLLSAETSEPQTPVVSQAGEPPFAGPPALSVAERVAQSVAQRT